MFHYDTLMFYNHIPISKHYRSEHMQWQQKPLQNFINNSDGWESILLLYNACLVIMNLKALPSPSTVTKIFHITFRGRCNHIIKFKKILYVVGCMIFSLKSCKCLYYESCGGTMSHYIHKIIIFISSNVKCYQNISRNSKDSPNTMFDLVCALHVFVYLMVRGAGSLSGVVFL